MANLLKKWSVVSKYTFAILFGMSFVYGVEHPIEGAWFAGIATLVALVPSFIFLSMRTKYLKQAELAKISFISERTGQVIDSVNIDPSDPGSAGVFVERASAATKLESDEEASSKALAHT